jgi:NADH-quinone oxidoreductase chain I
MLKPLLDGLQVTLKHFFKKPITIQYPEEKWIPPERFRGRLVLLCSDTGEPLCLACGLCEKICPCECIAVIPTTGADGVRMLQSYSIDLLRCCFCGLCVEACPVSAIAMGDEYELAEYHKEKFVLNTDALKAPECTSANCRATALENR